MGFPSDSAVTNPLAMQETQETWVQSLGQEDALEEEMATHSRNFAWEIPSVRFSLSVVSDSLPLQGLQHARPPYSSPTPGVYSNSCPLSR